MALEQSILFLCNGNSCRSKMAEAWTNKLFPQFKAYSAGVTPHTVNSYAQKAMLEKNLDLSLSTQSVEDFINEKIDYVIIVCDKASKNCQVNFDGAKVIHKNFEGPSKFARTKNSEEEKMDCYRKVRDEIQEFVLTLPDILAVHSLA